MQYDPINFLQRLWEQYGDAVHFRIGRQDLFFFEHPDLVRDVLVTHDRSFRKGLALQRTKIVLGEGLLTSEGDLHKRQRRLIHPAFHRDRISGYGDVMVNCAVEARERWKDGETIDVAREMSRLTMDVVSRTLFGANVQHEAEEIGRALTDLVSMFPLLLNPFLDILIRLPLPQVRRFQKALARLDRTIYQLIAERRRSGEDSGDLLSMLLLAQDAEADGGPMNDRQVRDEAMTLFLAGHETTANAMAWTWYLLAQNPEVERLLHEEIDSVLGHRLPTAADYPLLKYTWMVLAESMRLYPPAWGLGRFANEEVKVGPWTVPANGLVVLAQWVTHHDSRFWPDPKRFDPLRFSEGGNRPRNAYFPFGAGSRICAGESFAWMEGVLLLATIAQRWRFVGAPKVEPRAFITLRPGGGIPLVGLRR